MRDKSIEILSKHTSINTNVTHVKVLNLSNNSLTASSIPHILKILQFCIIEKLIILDNLIKSGSFTKLLNHYCNSSQSIANFKHDSHLVINRSVMNSTCTTNIYCIYLVNYKPNANVLLRCLLDKNGQAYEIVVLNKKKELSIVLKVLLKYSTLKVYSVFASVESLPLITWFLQKLYHIKIHNQFMSFNVFDILACQAGSKEFCMLINFLSNKSSIKPVKVLKLSCQHFDIDSLITKHLQFCTIQKLVMHSRFRQDAIVADVILFQFCTGTELLNSNLNVPLVLMNHVASHHWNPPQWYASIFMKFDEFDEFLCKLI